VSGGPATIHSPTNFRTYISGLTLGTYVFRLTAKDAENSQSDEMKIIVIEKPNTSPVAKAGADKSITLPANSVALSGSATDVDGGALTYTWSKVSGGAA